MAFYNESSLGYRAGLLEQASSTPLLLSSGNPYHHLSHEDCIIYLSHLRVEEVGQMQIGFEARFERVPKLYIYRNIVCIYIYILANRRAFAVPLVAM